MDNLPFITDEIKTHLPDELTPARNRPFYICPLCGSGTKGHKTGALTVSKDRRLWFCQSCKEGGDIVSLIEKRDGLSKADARQYLIDRYAPGMATQVARPAKNNYTAPKPTDDRAGERKQYIDGTEKRFEGSTGATYMANRALTPETCRQFRFGFDQTTNGGTGSVTIPYPGTDYYIKRPLQPIDDRKYLKPAGVSEPPFIAGDPGATIGFICEGQIDAISLIQAGAQCAIAAGGGGLSKFDDVALPEIMVVVADNDDPGKTQAGKTLEYLRGRGVYAIQVNPPEGQKDVNDVLVADPGQLSGLIHDWTQTAWKSSQAAADFAEEKQLEVNDVFGRVENEPPAPYQPPISAAQYINGGEWLVQSGIFSKYKDRKTGYTNMDEKTGFYPGVYLINAGTSMGKTTFCVQLADQVAARGETVLYYAFEQGAFDLTAKSITREAAAANTMSPHDTKYNAVAIRQGFTDPCVKSGIEKYLEYAGNVHYIDCAFGWTIDDVVKSITQYIEATGVAPVVFIDYLQVIKPANDHISDIKAIDYSVQAIRGLQMATQKAGHPVTFIVISSVSRDNYTKEADLSAGKGSGGLEFTADVVLGMQPRVMVTPKFKRAREQTKRNMIKKAKNPGKGKPRQIMIECTKNRFGQPDYAVGFDYYPANEMFVPDPAFDKWLAEIREREAKAAAAAEKKAEAEEMAEIAAVDKESGFLDTARTAYNAARKAIEDDIPTEFLT